METACRSVTLPDGRVLDVRPATTSDVDGLAALFDGLDADDRHLRFFSVFRPPREFLVDMVRVDEHRFQLVAVAHDGEDRIVGEAGYVLLPDGDGELAITVAKGWRGWLGPYLLGALVEAAAARGVPNLQAEVLLENRRMIALLRARGYAVLGHPDMAEARLTIGTSGTPTWPGTHDRPRILVETRGGRWRAEDAARAAGMAVMACPGPTPGRTPGCPVLEGRPCPLVDGADAIVFALPLADERNRTILDDHRRAANPPVCVVAPMDDPGVPAGVLRVPRDSSDAELLDVVEQLVGRRPEEEP